MTYDTETILWLGVVLATVSGLLIAIMESIVRRARRRGERPATARGSDPAGAPSAFETLRTNHARRGEAIEGIERQPGARSTQPDSALQLAERTQRRRLAAGQQAGAEAPDARSQAAAAALGARRPAPDHPRQAQPRPSRVAKDAAAGPVQLLRRSGRRGRPHRSQEQRRARPLDEPHRVLPALQPSEGHPLAARVRSRPETRD